MMRTSRWVRCTALQGEADRLGRAIAGIVPTAAGQIWLDDHPLTKLPPHRSVNLGLSYVPEGRQLFGSMSVLDNLALGAYSRGSGKGISRLGYVGWALNNNAFRTNIEMVFELFPKLKDRQKQMAGSLSGGEQQMLAIGRALMSSPRILLLDEPSLGLAPNLVREILHLLTRLRENGLTVLLVEQDALAALKIADRGYVMERGHIVLEGTSTELMQSDRVKQAYLGKTLS